MKKGSFTDTQKSVVISNGRSDEGDSANAPFRLYKERWIIAVVIILIQISISALWVSFSPIANIAASYYETSMEAINWMATVFLITDAILSLPAMWIFDKYGLKSVIYASCLTNAFGCAIRMLGTSQVVPHNYRYLVTIIGQTIASIACPFIMCAPTALSQQWFPTNQRFFITTLCSITSVVGNALGSLATSHIVTRPSQMDIMNYSFGAFGVISGLTGVLVRHSKPPTPPSTSANQQLSNIDLSSFTSQLKSIIKNKGSVILIICGGGIAMGVPAAFPAIIQQLICPWGYSNKLAGNGGFLNFSAAVVGSFVLVFIAEKSKKYEEVFMIAVAINGISFSIFIWIFQFPNMDIVIYILLAIYGVTSSGMLPLAMELGVEMSYPVNEGVMGNFVVFVGQLQGAFLIPLITLVEQPMNAKERQLETCTLDGLSEAHDLTYSIIFLVALNTLECIVLLLFCRLKYNRRNAEEIMQRAKEIHDRTITDSQLDYSVE